MDEQDEKIEQKTSNIFYCKLCDYSTSRKCNFDRHNISDKHKRITSSKMDEQNEQLTNKIRFICVCGNTYKWKQGLSKHKKICSQIVSNKIEDSEIKLLTNLVLEVVKQNSELVVKNNEAHKQNQELTNKLVEICKVSNNNTLINNNSNNTNNTFNLTVFLNETCKDAMNITDFVDSLKLQLSDLENVGKLGFVNGISNIIVKNLNSLDETKRPIHCSDSKREVMYIKDEDKWEKENEEKNKLRKVIKKIANKNSRLLPQFKEKYPDCNKSESKYSDQYNKLIIEAMGGSGDNDLEKEDKIIKNIAKEVTIDKNLY
jgi:hypothetical protein